MQSHGQRAASGAAASAGTFITFYPPGALGTNPNAINPEGAITGSYQDAGFVTHGYLRAPDGTFTTFDAPGAVGANPNAINPAGAITGWYTPADFSAQHGFLRRP